MTTALDPFGEAESLPAISWRDAGPGTAVTGTICDAISLVQQRHYETSELLTWPDGNPRLNIIVPLALPTGEEKALWVKKPSKLFAALQQAQKAAGAGPMAVGGTLSITLTGTEPHQNPRMNPFKCFSATYTPPAPVSAFDLPAEDESLGIVTQVGIAAMRLQPPVSPSLHDAVHARVVMVGIAAARRTPLGKRLDALLRGAQHSAAAQEAQWGVWQQRFPDLTPAALTILLEEAQAQAKAPGPDAPLVPVAAGETETDASDIPF